MGNMIHVKDIEMNRPMRFWDEVRRSHVKCSRYAILPVLLAAAVPVIAAAPTQPLRSPLGWKARDYNGRSLHMPGQLCDAKVLMPSLFRCSFLPGECPRSLAWGLGRMAPS